MKELFELFAKIAEQYMEMRQESARGPRECMMYATAEVVQDYGYVLLIKSYYEFLSEPQEVAQ